MANSLARYDTANRVYWVQEEPANMGPWTFVRERIQDVLLPQMKLAYAGRVPSASPAVGSLRLHRKQQTALLDAAFEGID
jgi:2-oxoglutarate dehydrogenase E1 component